jgi:hypothetical protein
VSRLIESYIGFLVSLIDEAKDVTELSKAKILNSSLGSDEDVAKLFNEIGTDLVPNHKIYRGVKRQIEEYYETELMSWISEFLHTRFNSPWTTMAFVGALSALGLSIVQTVYAIVSYYHSPNCGH